MSDKLSDDELEKRYTQILSEQRALKKGMQMSMNDDAFLSSLSKEEWEAGYPLRKTPAPEVRTRSKALELSERMRIMLNRERMDDIFEALAMTLISICEHHARTNKTPANAALLDFFGHTIELQREGSTQYDFRA
jgi:hypothetical protein